MRDLLAWLQGQEASDQRRRRARGPRRPAASPGDRGRRGPVPDVSVSIVNTSSRELLLACLALASRPT